MAITDLISKIILEDEFTDTFNKFNSQLEGAEGRADKLGQGLGKLGAFAAAAAPIGAAAAAVSEYIDVAIESETATVNLVSSVAAANREFGDSVGSVDSWKQTVEETAAAVRIFSEKDIATASTRLVDMTKRLGLTEEQMQAVLSRTIDLSAGKVELNDGIERVTAALRGEAESAEALGLSLSETQVMAYAEAQGLVFAQLTDNEKAQLRYALLMEQTNELQGRAGVIAQTAAGQQAAYNAQLENQSALIGEQLIPLHQGWAAAVGIVAGQSSEGIGFISQALATLLASLITVGVGFETWKNGVIAAVGNVKAGFDALVAGENPFTAIAQAEEASREQLAGFGQFMASIPETFTGAFDQIIGGWEQQRQAAEQAAVDIAGAQTTIAGGFDQEAVAARQAAEEIAAAHEKAKEDQEKATAAYNKRIADLEFSHGQRVVRIQQEVARDIAEARQEAVAAREAAAQDLADGLIEIETDLATGIADIQRDLASELADLDQQRADAREELNRSLAEIDRDFEDETREARRQLEADLAEIEQDRIEAATDRSRELRDIERELAQDLADLEFETGRERAEIAAELEAGRTKIATDLAKDREKVLADLEDDRLKAQEDAAAKRVEVEQNYQDAIKQLNSDFENEFAEADPFRRQILEFNREEQLKQLELQKNEEQAAIDEQEAAALAALQDKADSELSVLEAAAAAELAALEAKQAERLALLEEEAARDRERLEADAEFARLKAEEKFADQIADIARRQEAAEAEFEADQARREAEREAAREAAEQRFEDEAEQIARRRAQAEAEAAEATARRQQEAAEARTALQEQNAEELAAIDAQEQEKIDRANEQLAREQQNYADRLAELQHDNQQTQAEIQANLDDIERQEEDSWQRRLDTAQQYSDEIQQLIADANGAIDGSASSGAGLPPPSGGSSSTSITVINNGVPGGFSGASQTASSVVNALNGGA